MQLSLAGNFVALPKQPPLALCHGRGLMVWGSGGRGRIEPPASVLFRPGPIKLTLIVGTSGLAS